MRYLKRKLTVILLLTISVSCKTGSLEKPIYFTDESGCFKRTILYSNEYIGFISEVEPVDDSYCLNIVGHEFNDFLEVLSRMEEQRRRCNLSDN